MENKSKTYEEQIHRRLSKVWELEIQDLPYWITGDNCHHRQSVADLRQLGQSMPMYRRRPTERAVQRHFTLTATSFLSLAATTVVSNFAKNADLNFGCFTNSTLYFTAAMDEARIHSGIDDSNWLWASWATVATNSAFQSSSAVTHQTPQLAISTGSNPGVSVAWPGNGVGFGLYTTTNLAPPLSWTPVTNQPFSTYNQWEINLPPDGSSVHFYRVQSQ